MPTTLHYSIDDWDGPNSYNIGLTKNSITQRRGEQYHVYQWFDCRWTFLIGLFWQWRSRRVKIILVFNWGGTSNLVINEAISHPVQMVRNKHLYGFLSDTARFWFSQCVCFVERVLYQCYLLKTASLWSCVWLGLTNSENLHRPICCNERCMDCGKSSYIIGLYRISFL